LKFPESFLQASLSNELLRQGRCMGSGCQKVGPPLSDVVAAACPSSFARAETTLRSIALLFVWQPLQLVEEMPGGQRGHWPVFRVSRAKKIAEGFKQQRWHYRYFQGQVRLIRYWPAARFSPLPPQSAVAFDFRHVIRP
jgi:hypothetical protein